MACQGDVSFLLAFQFGLRFVPWKRMTLQKLRGAVLGGGAMPMEMLDILC